MKTQSDEYFMKRCIELARLAGNNASPNPMVGAVVVHNGQIIGEGFHHKCGEPHAEVNAIASVVDKSLLKQSTIYVSLEPCCHYGKTPPCADLIIANQIPRVVVGMQDPFAKVNGMGIKKLRDAGIEVVENVLRAECEELNHAFITFQQKRRPYVMLKWAQTSDGYIDAVRTDNSTAPLLITDEACRTLVHSWRSESGAIMVGFNTALLDNPRLDVRNCNGPSPLRIVTDRNLQLPWELHMFDQSQTTWILNQLRNENSGNDKRIQFNWDNLFPELMDLLYCVGVNQLFVEGGCKLLQSFIDAELWDEARVFTAPMQIGRGVAAPKIGGKIISSENIGDIKLERIMPQ